MEQGAARANAPSVTLLLCPPCGCQAATLELSPHVSAPGAFINVKTMYGKMTRASGTSFASPYVAGVLALWLQHQHAHAAAAGKPLAPGTVRQEAVLRALVATAKGVPDASNARFLEPVAKMGAGECCGARCCTSGCRGVRC